MLSAKVDQLNATPRLLLSAQTQPTGAASSTISTAPDLKTQLVALWKAIALSSRINTLSGSSQSPLTISNATVSGLSGLAVGDIPDLSSKYLPLTGATVPGSNIWTGLQQFTGNASTTGLSVFGLAYFGRTATSTFGADGSLTLASALGVGSGGTGWANINPGSILFGNGTSALATSSSLFWDNTNGRLGIGGALSVLGSANIASTTLTGNTLLAAATTTSLFASTFGLGSNYFTSLLGAGLANIGNALSLDLTHANLWTGLQQFFGNASTTQLSASSAYFGGTSTSTFTSAGWLGIGTTSPSKALSVLGDTLFSGTLNVSGGVTGASLFVTPGTGSALATLTAFDNTHDAATIFAVPGSRSWEIKANHSVDNNSLQFLNGIDGTMALQIGGTANTITTSGSVGIGTTSPFAKLALSLNNGGTNSNAFLISSSTINATTTLFTVANTGSATLAGTLTQNSDQRLKTNVLTLDASSSLSAIDALNPVSFSWINNMFGEGGQLGLIAQDVQKLFPQLVSTTSATALTPDGTLGLNYTGLIAPIIGAIQGIAHITGDFQKNLIAWLGNASNGITDFFARNGHFSNELCVGTTCVTPQQFQAMVAASGQTTTSPSSSGQGGGTLSGGADSSTSASPAVPPVIAITGDNPAIIHVGDTYADLGAIITGPAEDLNLGIHTFVGSTPIEQAVLDTSTTATYHIYYVATDSTGATATSTRTVIVQAVAATTP